ncbi:hypothetical protein A9Q86_04100 [Flavobacteriales bacterium 33_180_T64]|nr:hypothetical protein A9Q86_04100 [Flavobacteriales bacterium 33_180_T64]
MNIKLNFIRQYLYLILSLLGSSLLAQNQVSQFYNELPSEISSEIYFGMGLANFKDKIGTNALQTADDEFRLVYLQETNLPEITDIIYYFDTGGNKPLYEIIIIYKNEEQTNKVANMLFNKPNFNQSEWRFKNQGFPEIWSWIFKTKLVVVANIPNTEWSDNWNKQ